MLTAPTRVAGEPYDLSPAQAASLLPVNFAAFLVKVNNIKILDLNLTITLAKWLCCGLAVEML